MSLLRYLISVNKVLDLRYNDEIKNIEIRINLLHRVKFVAGGFVVRKIIWA